MVSMGRHFIYLFCRKMEKWTVPNIQHYMVHVLWAMVMPINRLVYFDETHFGIDGTVIHSN